MPYTRQTDIIIYETTDYEKFKFFPENRAVSSNWSLESSITQDNKLRVNPMVVDKDYNIIDGQHRHHIAKENNLPLFYIIDEDGSTEDIQKVNVGRRNWKLMDHILYFSKRGFPEYIRIMEYEKKHKIGVYILVELLTMQSSAGLKKSICSGEVNLRIPQERVEEILTRFDDVLELVIFYTNKKKMNKSIERAIILFVVHPDYDHERFIKAINLYPDGLRKAAAFHLTEHIVTTMRDDIYNKGYPSENRIDMERKGARVENY